MLISKSYLKQIILEETKKYLIESFADNINYTVQMSPFSFLKLVTPAEDVNDYIKFRDEIIKKAKIKKSKSNEPFNINDVKNIWNKKKKNLDSVSNQVIDRSMNIDGELDNFFPVITLNITGNRPINTSSPQDYAQILFHEGRARTFRKIINNLLNYLSTNSDIDEIQASEYSRKKITVSIILEAHSTITLEEYLDNAANKELRGQKLPGGAYGYQIPLNHISNLEYISGDKSQIKN